MFFLPVRLHFPKPYFISKEAIKKKLYFTLLTVAICLFAGVKLFGINGYATDSPMHVSVRTTKLSVGDYVGDYAIPADGYYYYKSSIILEGNAALGGHKNGLIVLEYYGNTFSVVPDYNTDPNGNKPVKELGAATQNSSITSAFNSDNYKMSFGIIGFLNDNDGVFVSVLFKTATNYSATASVVPIKSIDVREWGRNNESIDEALGNRTSRKTVNYTFTLGDINGDGVVNSYDAQGLISIISSNSYYISDNGDDWAAFEIVCDASSASGGMYVTFSGTSVTLFIPAVADVNNDGIVNSTDTSLLLDYYVQVVLMGMTNNTAIGTTYTSTYTYYY